MEVPEEGDILYDIVEDATWPPQQTLHFTHSNVGREREWEW